MLKALMVQEGYRRALRSPVRGLWTGALTGPQFFMSMTSVIRAGFTAAWRSGAAECGIQPDEYTDEERQALEAAIVQEYAYIGGFALAIEAVSKVNGGKLGPLFKRSELWMKRYLDIKNRAKQMACKNRKLEWVINPLKESCCSCLKLNGKIKRAVQWEGYGVRPQHPSLHCMESAGGVSVCGCEFRVTDKPMSKGPLPNWRC